MTIRPSDVDLALQQRVGRDRGAVRQAGDVVGRAAGRVEDRVDAADQADGGIGGRAGDLGDAAWRRSRYRRETISVKVPPVSIPIR